MKMLFLRASIALLFSFLIILVYEYVYRKSCKENGSLLYWVILVAFGLTLLPLSSVFLRGLTTVAILRPTSSPSIIRIQAGVRGLLGYWIPAILIQVGE